MLYLDFALLCFCSSVFNSLALPLLTSFRFSTPSFLLSFAFALLQRLCFFGESIYCNLNVKIVVSYQTFFPAIVQYPIALVSSGFDGLSIPLLMFSIGIYILPLISKLLSACCGIFVHCALSLIILFYICACCDTRCFKMFVYSCLSK